jgi:hypothetical protein
MTDINRREALAGLLGLPAMTVMTRTTVEPFDLFVFSAPGAISQEAAERIKRTFEQICPPGLNVRAIVLSDGMTVSVVRKGAKPGA